MFSKNSFILALIIVLLLLFSCIGCEFRELGISSQESEPTDSEIMKTIISEELSGEELFLQLKSKQLDNNPLSDINVRKAIFHAIDRQRIVESLIGDFGEVVNSLFLEDSPYYHDAWSIYDHDKEKAAEYLEKAGYSKENPLYLTIGATNDSTSKLQVEEFIKEDLSEIGINIWFFNREPKEWYVDYLKNGEFELGIWALYSVDGRNLENYFSSDKIPPMESETNKNCDNFYWYDNQELEDLFNSFDYSREEATKIEVMAQIQEEIACSAFTLPLYRRLFCIVHDDAVSNIEIDKRMGNFLKNANEWSIKESSQEEDELEQVTVGYQYEPYTLNPLSQDTSHRDFILSLMTEGLWDIDDYGRYIPNLIRDDIEIEENDIKALLRARATLREGVYWEDGSEMNTDDIKDTIDYLVSTNSENISDKDYSIIKEIKIIDEYEFEIVFKEYRKDWQGLFDYIFPSKLIEEGNISNYLENDFYSHGPYKLSDWLKGDYMLFDKNYYSENDARIDQIKIVFNSDINYLIGFFKEGEIDVLNIPADMTLIEDLDSGENSSVIVEQGNLWEQLALSLKPKE